MDLDSLIKDMYEEGDIMRMARSPRSQFGSVNRNIRYIGAEILPEMMKEANSYIEEDMSIRTVIADDSTRYSPPQIKDRAELTDFEVMFGEIDLKRTITGQQFDRLLKLLNSNSVEAAKNYLMGSIDRLLVDGLQQKKELQRWNAIVNAELEIKKGSGIIKTMSYPNPAGHRYNAAGVWSNNAYNPFDDIFAGYSKLRDKGYMLNRIITSNRVRGILAKNEQVRTTVGGIRIDTDSSSFEPQRRLGSLGQINAYLNDEDLPAIELYDATYFTQTSEERFLPDNVMVLIASTPRDLTIDLGEGDDLLLNNMLGYYGQGIAQGQVSPGNVVKVFPKEEKPVGMIGESYSTGLPVIQEPGAIVVIKNIG